MDISGSQIIVASRPAVWAALNNPDTLQACIPGCESLTASGPDQYAMVMLAAVGPVKARFKAQLTLSDIVAGASYTMTFDGSGGAAGFGKGQARVSLEDEQEEEGQVCMRLDYTAQVQVGGKIAQVGARLIDGVAKKLTNAFFANFKARVETPSEDGAAEEETAASAPSGAS